MQSYPIHISEISFCVDYRGVSRVLKADISLLRQHIFKCADSLEDLLM